MSCFLGRITIVMVQVNVLFLFHTFRKYTKIRWNSFLCCCRCVYSFAKDRNLRDQMRRGDFEDDVLFKALFLLVCASLERGGSNLVEIGSVKVGG